MKLKFLKGRGSRFVFGSLMISICLLFFQNCGKGFEAQEMTLSSNAAEGLTTVTDNSCTPNTVTACNGKNGSGTRTCNESGHGPCLLNTCDTGFILDEHACLTPSEMRHSGEIMSVGSLHTCVITSAGGVKCWGSNQFGQLGNNSLVDSLAPVDVQNLTQVISLSVSQYYSCALASNRMVYCWGNSKLGEQQKIMDYTSESKVPVRIAGLTSVKNIANGGLTFCAIDGGDRVMCWGAGDTGALGNNTTVGYPNPVYVQGLTNVQALSGSGHFCALIEGGIVKCWGENKYGVLGNGTELNSSVPVQVPNLSKIVSVKAGARSTCVLTEQGTVKCWGNNEYGQLGNNSTLDSFSPVDVQGLSDIKAIAVGLNHACAITADATVKCWGRNASGQLGNGWTFDSPVPVDVKGLSNVNAISIGGDRSCATLANNTVKCWGAGVLSFSSDGYAVIPTEVSGLVTTSP